MSHDPKQPRRTGHATLKRVPLKPQVEPDHQRLLLAAGVGLSALVIFGLYAASFRYQRVLTDDASDLPRWGTLKNDVMSALEPIQEQANAIGNVKATMEAVIGAKVTQAEGIAIMKQKLESATSTKTN